MRFKLDENLGRRGKDLLTASGHDVATIYDQNLTQAAGADVIKACQQEDRCLVTLDLDFENPLRFNPTHYSGIAVLKLPSKPSYDHLLITIRTLIKASETESIDKQLWIVELGRIRIYRAES